MKKAIISILFIAGLLVFWREPLISLGGQWILKLYSSHYLAQNFNCENLSYHDGKFIVEHPTISNEQQEITCKAHQALVAIHIHPLKFLVDLDLILDSPEIYLKEGSLKAIPIIQDIKHSSKLLKLSSHIVIKEGTIRYGNSSLGFINMEVSTGEKVSGKLHGSGIPLSFISDIFQILHPKATHWYVEHGMVDGDLSFDFQTKRTINLDGKLKLNNIAMHYAPLTLDINLPEVEMSIVHRDITTGKIELMKPGSLMGGEMGWENLTGSLTLTENIPAQIELNGFSRFLDEKKPLKIRGAFLENHDAELNMIVGDHSSSISSADIRVKTMSENNRRIDALLKQIGPLEIYLLQSILNDHVPYASDLYLTQGIIDAKIHADIRDSVLSDISVEELNAIGMKMELASLPLAISIDQLGGTLSLDFSSPDILDTLHSNLKLTNGHAYITDTANPHWHFSNIDTRLVVQDGIIHHSQASVELGGLKGIVDLDWTAHNPLKIVFSGTADHLAKFLPTPWQKIVEENFANEKISLKTNIKKKKNGVEIGGELQLFASDLTSSDTFLYGFEVHNAQQSLKIPQKLLPKITPSLLSPVASMTTNFLKKQVGQSGYVIKDGWFTTQNLSLDRYVSPILFPDNFFKVRGVATEIIGTFDHTQIQLRYDTKDLSIENEDLTFDVAKLGKNEKNQQLPASHYFNLSSGNHLGYLPIANGSYFEKNSGLLFTDLNSLVVFEGKNIHLIDADTYCNGMFFRGTVDVDYSSPNPGVFDVALYPSNIHGKISQLQHLFSHFDKPFFFLKLPLEGNIDYNGQDGLMKLSFFPGDYKLQAKLNGNLTDGILKSSEKDLMIQDLSMNFEYDHVGNTLFFNNIQGALLVGKPEHVEEYMIAGDQIHFTDYQHNESNFDLWVGDKHRDIIRVAGQTINAGIDKNGENVRFDLDHRRSHFGNVHPKDLQLTLRNWSEVESFILDVDFRLDSLFHDLQRFSRTGLLLLSPQIIQEVNQLSSATGNIDISIDYIRSDSALNVKVGASDLAMGDFCYKNCILTGKKHDKLWSIDQLQLDELNIALDFQHKEDLWDISFLGVKYGKSLLMGLEGSYSELNKKLDAKMNLFELDFGQLHELKPLRAFVEHVNPKGKLKAQGQLSLDLFKDSRIYQLDATLHAALKDVTLKDWAFDDSDQVALHYNSEKGLSIDNANFKLLEKNEPTIHALVNVQKIEHLFSQNSWNIKNFSFQAPVEQLPNISQHLQSTLPDAISPSLCEMLISSKSSGSLIGSFDLEHSPNSYLFKLTLADDTYKINNSTYDLQNFLFQDSPTLLKCSGKTTYNKCPIWFIAKSQPSDKDHGEIILLDHNPNNPIREIRDNLVVDWQKNPIGKINILKAKGILSDLDINLHSSDLHTSDADNPSFNPDTSIALEGTINIIGPNVPALICEEFSQKMKQWEIGKGYTLNGNWLIQRDAQPGNTPDVHYFGRLDGRDFQMRGYQLDELSAQIEMTPNELHVKNLNLIDQGGKLSIPDLKMKKITDSDWNIEIPNLKVNDLRPSILQAASKPIRGAPKPLLIRNIDVENIHGTLKEIPHLSGYGTLDFINPARKNFQNTIFAIPAEILLRVGLDLHLLTPVVGSINYEIKGDKIYVTKFKDVYSDGRGSKFYLAHNNLDQSWIDFDGNINMQVKMKQYNLVFKIAELFTVNINGTLRNPTYSLQPLKGKN